MVHQMLRGKGGDNHAHPRQRDPQRDPKRDQPPVSPNAKERTHERTNEGTKERRNERRRGLGGDKGPSLSPNQTTLHPRPLRMVVVHGQEAVMSVPRRAREMRVSIEEGG